MRIFLAVFASVLYLLFSQVNDVFAYRGLEISISFDRDEYRQSDPVYINFKIENKRKRPVYVNKRFYLNSEESPEKHREVYLTVQSPSGEELVCKASYETGLPKTDYFVLLKPDEETISDRKQNIKGYFDFKETGLYKITAIYQNIYGKEIGIDALKDMLISKPVTIRIVE